MKIHEAINQALKIWVEATGFDPESKSIRMSEFGIHSANRTIREAQDLDALLTTFLVLRAEAREFAKSVTFDALEVLEDENGVTGKTASLKRLLGIVNDPECMELVREFQESLRKSAKVSGLLETVEKEVQDLGSLAYIRRDALRGHKELKVHHFAAGKRGTSPPKYNPNLIKFWNIQSALAYARLMPEDGVNLVMVRDPVALFSFFAFVVRNGEYLDILTDQDAGAHPLHKHMTRGGGNRSFEDRSYRLRFPYELFDFELDHKGRFVQEHSRGTLVPIDAEGVIVKPIRKIEGDQALWLLMMFDLIKEVYWKQDPVPDPILSFTGSGMVAEKRLPAVLGKKGLSMPGRVSVPQLGRADITRTALKTNWVNEPTGQHNWMEDRYGPQVPEEVFNLVGSEKTYRLLDGRNIKPWKMLPKPSKKDDNGMDPRDESKYELVAVEPGTFGTPEQMEKDRRFLARYNQATVIRALADKEYHERKEEIEKWYEESVRKNGPRLVDAMVRGTFVSEVQDKPPDLEEGQSTFEHGIPQPGQILRLYQDFHRPSGTWGAVGLVSLRENKYRCFVGGERASIWGYFKVMTAKSLADMAGCSVGQLPDVLRHWEKVERYDGNCILDRIDPMEWRCKNPWREMEFDVVVGISRRTLKRLCKEKGLPLPALPDFPKKKDE